MTTRTRSEKIAADRLEAAIEDLSAGVAPYSTDLREFARAVALVAVEAMCGSRENPSGSIEITTGGPSAAEAAIARYALTPAGEEAAKAADGPLPAAAAVLRGPCVCIGCGHLELSHGDSLVYGKGMGHCGEKYEGDRPELQGHGCYCVGFECANPLCPRHGDVRDTSVGHRLGIARANLRAGLEPGDRRTMDNGGIV